jgi:hypothetical protein
VENSCLHGTAEILINASVIHSANLRRSNPVAYMASVKGAWTIIEARREEGTADT